MKRKTMMGLIAVAVIVSVAIFPIHAEIEEVNASENLQNISIKINVTASTWREGEEPYDIYNATKWKLERVGFKVVSKESTVYDAILFINYEEQKGPPYYMQIDHKVYGLEYPFPEVVGYGTIITCSLRLEDREYGLLFNEHITASTPGVVEYRGRSLYDEAISDFKNDVRFKCLGVHIAKRYGEIGDERAVELLIQALKDEYSSSVRWEAAEALDELGYEPKNDTEKAYYLIARKNWDELVKMGEPAVEPLIHALKDEDSGVRREAIKTLVKIGEPAVEPLIQALKDEDSDVRRGAAWALGKIGDERAVEPLTEALEDEYQVVREAAKKALADIQKQKILSFGLILIFAIAGLLAVAYVLRRRK